MTFPILRDGLVQESFRHEKNVENALLTQRLSRKVGNGLIVDLQGFSPTFEMQATPRGAGVESGGYAVYVKSMLFDGHGAGLWPSIYIIESQESEGMICLPNHVHTGKRQSG